MNLSIPGSFSTCATDVVSKVSLGNPVACLTTFTNCSLAIVSNACTGPAGLDGLALP